MVRSLSLLTLIALLGPVAPAGAGSTVLVRMVDYGFRPGTVRGLSTNPLDPGRDHPIVWRNDGTQLHDAIEIHTQRGIRVRARALSGGESSSGLRLKNAATYRYLCSYHPSMKGKVKIRPALYKPGNPGNYDVTQGPGGKAVLRLGHNPLPSKQVMDVQRRRGSGDWTTVVTGTTRRTIEVSPNMKGKYRFRTRIRHTGKDTKTAWSPVSKTLTVT